MGPLRLRSGQAFDYVHWHLTSLKRLGLNGKLLLETGCWKPLVEAVEDARLYARARELLSMIWKHMQISGAFVDAFPWS